MRKVRFREFSSSLWTWELIQDGVVRAVAAHLFPSLDGARLDFLKLVWAVEDRGYQQEVLHHH